jgi:hypothetical protein
MRDLYPTTGDLQKLLSGSGTPLNEDGRILAATLDAAIDGFETEVGWHMLAGKNSNGSDRAATTRSFYQEYMNEEPQGMIQLNLEAFGALGRIDSVVFNIPNTTPQTLVEGTDWWRMPQFAGDEGRPWTWLRILPYATLFFGLLPLYGAHIDVTGLWGWPAIPGDAWLGMLYGAALTYFEGSWAGVRSGGPQSFPVKSVSAPGGVQQVWDTTWYLQRRQMWMGAIDAAISRYKRLSIA